MRLEDLTTEQLKTRLAWVKAFSFAGTYGNNPVPSEELANLFEERQRIREEIQRREENK